MMVPLLFPRSYTHPGLRARSVVFHFEHVSTVSLRSSARLLEIHRTFTYTYSSTARVYTLEYADELESSSWANLPGQVDIPGAGGPDSLQDPGGSPAHRAYRIGVGPPPGTAELHSAD